VEDGGECNNECRIDALTYTIAIIIMSASDQSGSPTPPSPNHIQKPSDI